MWNCPGLGTSANEASRWDMMRSRPLGPFTRFVIFRNGRVLELCALTDMTTDFWRGNVFTDFTPKWTYSSVCLAESQVPAEEDHTVCLCILMPSVSVAVRDGMQEPIVSGAKTSIS